MPSHHCRHPTCPDLVAQPGYCQAHQHLAPQRRAHEHKTYDQSRRDPEAKRFYNSKAWKATRLIKLAGDPICQLCEKATATDVHHLIALRADWAKALDLTNLQSLCGTCHKRIEASQRTNERHETPKRCF